jgi:hypothetical protein
VLVLEYRFDKDHNSYYRLAQKLRAAEDAQRPANPAQAQRVQEAVSALTSKDRAARQAALEKLSALGTAAADAAGPIFRWLPKAADAAEKEQALAVLKRISGPKAYPAAVVREVERLAALRPTGLAWSKVGTDGRLALTVRAAGNGASFVVIVPAGAFP